MLTPNPSNYHRLTASAILKSKGGVLRGFYVASTSTGTIQFFDGTTNGGTPITGVITPSAGWNSLGDVAFAAGCYAQITNTLDVTVSEWE